MGNKRIATDTIREHRQETCSMTVFFTENFYTGETIYNNRNKNSHR